MTENEFVKAIVYALYQIHVKLLNLIRTCAVFMNAGANSAVGRFGGSVNEDMLRI